MYIETLEKLVIVSEHHLPHGIQGIYYANLKQLDLRECSSLTDKEIFKFNQFSKETKCKVLFPESDDRIKKNEVTMNKDEIFDMWLEEHNWKMRTEEEERRRESR
ncbi:MAG: hypothetical protein ACOX2O_01535 [Bdellovibrionota bacterium]|jgi:hypothetical protein